MLPFLVLLFTASGCSALIYEVVWFQLLQLVIGSTGVSLAILLATFMGGMCLGSLLAPRVIPLRRHPLAIYGFLELAIGVCGLAVLFGMPHLAAWYAPYSVSGSAGLAYRALLAAACLLMPAILLGGTLPAAARWFESAPRGAAGIGVCYSANLFGGVLGCLVAGFYLLRVYDLATATYVAVAINSAAGLAAFMLSRIAPYHRVAIDPIANSGESAPHGGPVYAAIALSGFMALVAEVLWTRLLALLFGGTVYSFSIILAAFLAGLGIGSVLGSLAILRSDRRKTAFGLCQLLLGLAIAWSAYELSESMPYWPIVPALARSPWFTFQLDFLRGLWVILPAATLWGASFPLAISVLARPGLDPGRITGRLYAANTLGAILGALAGSLVLLPSLGTQQTHRCLIGISLVSGLLLLLTSTSMPRWKRLGIGVVSIATGIGLMATVPPVSSELIAWGRSVPTIPGPTKILFQGEGIHASVVVAEPFPDVRSFHVAGKIEASSAPQDMRLQRMLGHIPALLHPRPRSVLIVGCGAGVTAGCFTIHPGIERIVICEIEPLVPRVASEFFANENHHVLSDPRTQLVLDDARHFLAQSNEEFDIITTDPMHPWVKGAAVLYTQEYLELCRRRLKPGGLVTQWVPLYESDETTVKSELATFATVFPEATVWANTLRTTGYDTVLLGQNGPPTIIVSELVRRLARGDHGAVRAALQEVGIGSIWDLFGTYAARTSDLGPWLKGAPVNRDRNLRLQYLAGFSANTYQSGSILEEMLRYRHYPDGLFQATDEDARRLRSLIAPFEK